MASNLQCIGLRLDEPSDLRWLLEQILGSTTATRKPGGRLEYRWQDPSGSRLSFAMENGEFDDFTPSFAGETSVQLGTVESMGSDVFIVDVLDSSAEIVTRAAVDPIDKAAFSALAESGASAGAARFTALGVQVQVHENAETFLESDASLFGSGRPREEVGPPARFAAESFISYGSFGLDEANATAGINGTVLHAERRTVELTAESFIAARVRTSGFEVDLCFPSDPAVPVPVPGNIIGGIVYLVVTQVDDHSFERPTGPGARFLQALGRATRWARAR